MRLAWFPGPDGAGWGRFVERGFHEAIAESSAEVVAICFGDTDIEQGRLDLRHAGPAIVTLTGENFDRIGSNVSLAPACFVPVFRIDAAR